jgi:hypothetical protein
VYNYKVFLILKEAVCIVTAVLWVISDSSRNLRVDRSIKRGVKVESSSQNLLITSGLSQLDVHSGLQRRAEVEAFNYVAGRHVIVCRRNFATVVMRSAGVACSCACRESVT